MKITIEAEVEQEKKNLKKPIIYNKVFEFALIGTATKQDIIPYSVAHTHGDPFVLIGKLEELKERLRKYKKGDLE